MLPARVLLWTDSPATYLDAIAAADLSSRVAVEALPRKDTPTEAQRADIEAMLAWGAPAGLLPKMEKLRWVQALTAGVEGWLALPDLLQGLTLTSARGTHTASRWPRTSSARCSTSPSRTRPSYRTRNRANGCAASRRRSPARRSASSASAPSASRWRTLPTPSACASSAPSAAPNHCLISTDDVLAQSDFVLLLLPAAPETENYINAQRLTRMKPTAWLLNFGRGHLIANADLIAAVKAKQISGAVLDVFRHEPLPSDHLFWTTEGIIVLPHIGGGHPKRDKVVAKLFVENLRRFLDGEELKEVVDRAAGY